MRGVHQLGKLDPSFGWDGAALLDGSEDGPGPPATLRGAYAAVQSTNQGIRVVRDPLGINKLFWAVADGILYIAARPYALLAAGCPFADIRAIPPGVVLEIDLARERVWTERLMVPDRASAASPSLDEIAGAIRCALGGYVASLARAYPNAAAYVCLSGGLDSTGAALLVREAFDDVTAVSFDIARAEGRASGDRTAARRLAGDLDLAFLDVTPDADTLLDGLDVVLREAVDWRDFNVHAALVKDRKSVV